MAQLREQELRFLSHSHAQIGLESLNVVGEVLLESAQPSGLRLHICHLRLEESDGHEAS